ncbi:dTMP kinase [Krasilnikovia sp. M28-CT-15]
MRFLLFASIPLLAITGASGTVVVGWAAVATFLIETVTLLWIPAKEAAVPNLIPRARLEAANQLTLITTYGLTPIAAAIGLAVLDRTVRSLAGPAIPGWAEPAQLALWFNAFSRLAIALVVAFGIKEISQGQASEQDRTEQSLMSQFTEGWRYISQTPLVRGLVLGIFGAFAGGGIVIGTAKFFSASLGAGDAAFYMLFGAIFIGLAFGIGLGPMIVRDLSRRRWFGLSIVLASASVLVLAFAIHLSMALLGAILVGVGAGMAFLAGITLLGGEVADEVRGRVFAVVQIGTRMVLILAIGLSSLLVGVGGSRRLTIAEFSVPVSFTRLLLLAAGLAGIFAGISAFRQMDDKIGVPILADLWGSLRGRPLLLRAESAISTGLFIVFEGGVGAGKSTQLEALAEQLRGRGREVVVAGEPGATTMCERIRSLARDTSADRSPSPRAEALLYAAEQAHHVETVVRPALARGAVVIGERYVDASLAGRSASGALQLQEASSLWSWASGGLKPDLVVLLDIDPNLGLLRVSPGNQEADHVEVKSGAFHEQARYAFLDLAANDPNRYLVLDAASSAGEIADMVVRRVDGFLSLDPR